MSKSDEKDKRNRTRHEFLLTFFSPEAHYQTQEVNGYMLVKQFNGGNNMWEVAIFTMENWRKVEEWKSGRVAVSEPQPTA